MTTLLLFVLAARLQDELTSVERIRLEELSLALDADSASARAGAQRELDAYLDRDARAAWVREKLKTAEGERKARLQQGLEAFEFTIAEHIAFVRGGQIWIMSANGRSARPVSLLGTHQAPAFSPDGKRIAYVCNASGAYEIHVMDADGKNALRLTHSNVGFFDPVFASDGKSIVFSRDGTGKGIQSVGLTGGALKELSEVGEWPSLSPDGKVLLFTGRERTATGQIYQRALGAKTYEPLTDVLKPRALNFCPRFSPDGKKIAFTGWNPGGAGGLFLMDADGKNLKTLPATGRFIAWPSFSPDGKKLAYCRMTEELRGMNDREFVLVKPEIATLDLESQVETVLGEGSFPAWGPRIKR